MAKCGYCGTTVVLGGKKAGGLTFCNDRCYSMGALMSVADQVPDDVLQRRIREVYMGPCPDCGGSGPVDVQTSHSVWSAFVLTSWKSTPRISCRSCGAKRKVGDTVFSLFAGWWGFPWGLVMTPVQIARNVAGLISQPDSSEPSAQLATMVKLDLARQLVQTGAVDSPSSPPC